MKLSLLSEGFDFNKPGEQVRCSTIQGAVDQLQKIVENVRGSRISTTRALLRGLRRLINGVTIESDEEQEQINEILSLIAAITTQLTDLPDGPPSEEVVEHISILSQMTYDFCIRHMHRGDNAI